MPKIEVKFSTDQKTSKAGRPYTLIEMWMTDRDGGWPERPTFGVMPFHARMLLQHLPEFCKAVADADGEREQQQEEKSEVPF